MSRYERVSGPMPESGAEPANVIMVNEAYPMPGGGGAWAGEGPAMNGPQAMMPPEAAYGAGQGYMPSGGFYSSFQGGAQPYYSQFNGGAPSYYGEQSSYGYSGGPGGYGGYGDSGYGYGQQGGPGAYGGYGDSGYGYGQQGGPGGYGGYGDSGYGYGQQGGPGGYGGWHHHCHDGMGGGGMNAGMPNGGDLYGFSGGPTGADSSNGAEGALIQRLVSDPTLSAIVGDFSQQAGPQSYNVLYNVLGQELAQNPSADLNTLGQETIQAAQAAGMPMQDLQTLQQIWANDSAQAATNTGYDNQQLSLGAPTYGMDTTGAQPAADSTPQTAPAAANDAQYTPVSSTTSTAPSDSTSSSAVASTGDPNLDKVLTDAQTAGLSQQTASQLATMLQQALQQNPGITDAQLLQSLQQNLSQLGLSSTDSNALNQAITQDLPAIQQSAQPASSATNTTDATGTTPTTTTDAANTTTNAASPESTTSTTASGVPSTGDANLDKVLSDAQTAGLSQQTASQLATMLQQAMQQNPGTTDAQLLQSLQQNLSQLGLSSTDSNALNQAITQDLPTIQQSAQPASATDTANTSTNAAGDNAVSPTSTATNAGSGVPSTGDTNFDQVLTDAQTSGMQPQTAAALASWLQQEQQQNPGVTDTQILQYLQQNASQLGLSSTDANALNQALTQDLPAIAQQDGTPVSTANNPAGTTASGAENTANTTANPTGATSSLSGLGTPNTASDTSPTTNSASQQVQDYGLQTFLSDLQSSGISSTGLQNFETILQNQLSSNPNASDMTLMSNALTQIQGANSGFSQQDIQALGTVVQKDGVLLDPIFDQVLTDASNNGVSQQGVMQFGQLINQAAQANQNGTEAQILQAALQNVGTAGISQADQTALSTVLQNDASIINQSSSGNSTTASDTSAASNGSLTANLGSTSVGNANLTSAAPTTDTSNLSVQAPSGTLDSGLLAGNLTTNTSTTTSGANSLSG